LLYPLSYGGVAVRNTEKNTNGGDRRDKPNNLPHQEAPPNAPLLLLTRGLGNSFSRCSALIYGLQRDSK
jgi:hypothetical protein